MGIMSSFFQTEMFQHLLGFTEVFLRTFKMGLARPQICCHHFVEIRLALFVDNCLTFVPEKRVDLFRNSDLTMLDFS